MQSTVSIDSLETHERQIDTYISSTGEAFAILECYDLLNIRSIQAFPYTKEGEINLHAVANCAEEEDIPKSIEAFLITEATQKAQKEANMDPVREAFNKGRRDAKAQRSKDATFLANINEDAQEAYEYAYEKFLAVAA
ncbi:hypothetical protein F7U66_01285 [Vibrio parahaemolyticus]|nr:hypothetical protein [Vibrio parahaemolyticus]